MSAWDLGVAVIRRRRELGLAQSALESLGGPSGKTIRLIEDGQHAEVRPSTLQKLDVSLSWKPGSANALLDAGALPVAEFVSPTSDLSSEDRRALRIGHAVMVILAELHAELGHPS